MRAMIRTLTLALLPAAALLAIAAKPATIPERSPLLVSVAAEAEDKLRGERMWVTLEKTDGKTTEAILLNYRRKTGELTIAPDEQDLLKHVQVSDGSVKSIRFVKAYVSKPVDPLAEVFTHLSKQVKKKWEKTLLEILQAKEGGELDEYIRKVENKIKGLAIQPGSMRDRMRAARRAHEVMRVEMPKLLFAYAAKQPDGDKQWLQKAARQLGGLTEKIKDRHVREMYRRRVDGLRKSAESGGTPDVGRRPDWRRSPR